MSALEPQRPVLVIGGSSQVGYFLRRRLAAAGHVAHAISRHPGHSDRGWSWQQGALPAAMPGQGPLAAILSAGPLAALAEWLEQVPQLDCPWVVATSSMSAESKRASPLAAERALAQQLREAEQRLARVCRQQGRHWVLLRPTLIYGAGLDRSLSPIARAACRWRVFPLLPGRGLRQPVHADDVAAALYAAIGCQAAAGQIMACGGGERLSAGEMFLRVRRSLPQRLLAVPVPALAVRLAARLMPARAGMLARLEQDLVADNDALQTVLGIRPRGFQPQAASWFATHPATA